MSTTGTPGLPIDEARAVWFGAQLLDGAADDATGAVARAGYVRTLGGVDVYLALRARMRGATRDDIDGAVAAGDLRVVPSVRGCIYLVRREDVPWSLRIADLLSRRRREREYEKSGIEGGELGRLGEAILQALEGGESTTHELRKRLGERVRSLGEAGKKVGISSTLPPALRELEFSGAVERVLEGGRLDTERYLWRPTRGRDVSPGPPDDPGAVHDHLATRFFGAVGLGKVDRFAEWAGIGKRDARAAADRVGLEAVDVDGADGPFYRLGGREGAGSGRGVALLPFEDNLIQLLGGAALLVDPRHHGIQVPNWGRKGEQPLGSVAHMAFRSIVVDGRLVGFWEFDPDEERVVVGLFVKLGEGDRARVEEEAEEVTRFLRDDIGRAISFSLDTDDDLRRRSRQVSTFTA